MNRSRGLRRRDPRGTGRGAG